MPIPFSNDEVLDFLRRNPIMTIAVCADDRPMSSVLLYYVDNDFNFYFGTKERTYKARALKRVPKISLSVWEHKKMLVQADGLAEVVISEAEEILDRIISSTLNIDDFWPPVLHTEEDPYMIFKITTNWLRVMDLSNSNISTIEPPFQLIQNKYEQNLDN